MSAVSIRAAETRDNAAITRIYAHAVLYGTASFETEPPDEAEMARRQAALRVSGHPFLVAELAGAIGFRLVGTFEAVGFKFGRWLDSVLMQRQLQASGIGRQESGNATRPDA